VNFQGFRALRKISTRRPVLGLLGAGLSAAIALGAASPAFARPAANSPAQEEVRREFSKSFTLSGNQGLSLDHKLGQVRIHGVPGHELKISATIHVQDRNSADANDFAQKIQIDVREAGDGIHVRTIYPESRIPTIRIGGRTSYSVDYEISLPADAPLWLRNDFGNSEVTGVHGWGEISNGHGNLVVRDSGGVKLVNSFGKIELSNASGNSTINNNNGAVTVSNVKGTLEIHDRFGEIEASQISGGASISGGNGAVSLTNSGGNSTINNSFGEVSARNINGNLSVSNSNGKIDASDISGSAELKTSFGAVEASRIGGALTVNSSNGATNLNEVHRKRGNRAEQYRRRRLRQDFVRFDSRGKRTREIHGAGFQRGRYRALNRWRRERGHFLFRRDA